jgi:hypothetical protein
MPKFQKLGPSEGFNACDEEEQGNRSEWQRLRVDARFEAIMQPLQPPSILKKASVLEP